MDSTLMSSNIRQFSRSQLLIGYLMRRSEGMVYAASIRLMLKRARY